MGVKKKSCKNYVNKWHCRRQTSRHFSVHSSHLFIWKVITAEFDNLSVSPFSLCAFSGQVIHIELLWCDQWWRFHGSSPSGVFVSNNKKIFWHDNSGLALSGSHSCLTRNIMTYYRFIENNNIKSISRHTFRGLKSLIHLWVWTLLLLFKLRNEQCSLIPCG